MTSPHQQTGSSWEERFEKIIKDTDYSEYTAKRFCCGGDYCEGDHNDFIKDFIRQTIQEERSNAITECRHAILDKLAKHIENMKVDFSDKENWIKAVVNEGNTGVDMAKARNDMIEEIEKWIQENL